MKREPLVINYLIPEHQRVDEPTRRVSVAEHERFRADMQRRLRAMQQPDPINNELETDFGCHPAAASNEGRDQ
jgi:hypothetical protein